MHLIKFEKNWSSGYQEKVKNVQMLTDTIYHVWPHHGGKTATNFTILVESFLLYITIMYDIFRSSSTCAVVEKIF
jgi:hypothetical protein